MRWSQFLTAACAFLVACSNDPSAVNLGDLAPPACNDPNPPDGGVCGIPVFGQVVDESGAAVAALTVSVCADGCFFGTTGADGKFIVLPDQHIVLSQYALELHGRPDRASYYTPLAPLGGKQIQFPAALTLPSLPASGPEILMDGTAQTLTSGDLTLTLAANTTVLFDVEDFGTPNGHQLRVSAVDRPARFGFSESAPLYACSPFEASFKPKASLKLANRAGFPAGSAVMIRSLRGLINDGPPAGHFQNAALAHVSADGATLSTDPGEGVGELTWFTLQKM